MRGGSALREAGDARGEFVGRLGRDEGLRVFIVDVEELANRALRFGDAALRATRQLLAGGAGYNNPTSGPTTISSAVISTTQTALMTSPAGSMSNIR